MTRNDAAHAHHSEQARTDAAYNRWAPVYDLIFDLPFHPGRLASARAAGEATPPNGELLVVGVGTGLELDLLPVHAQVTGIDVSAPMLDIARERVRRRNLHNVRSLLVMDGGAMTFEPQRFDCVIAPFVMSVVPHPALVLDSMWSVLKPGGELIIVNHFFGETGLRGRFEAWLERKAGWLGWHPAFPFARIGDWVAARPDAFWLERRDVQPLKLFTMLRIGKRA